MSWDERNAITPLNIYLENRQLLLMKTVTHSMTIITFGVGGGGGQGGATVLLPTNFSVNAEVAEANGLPFNVFPLFAFLGRCCSSVSSNSKVGFHSSVCPLRDNDVISFSKLAPFCICLSIYVVFSAWSLKYDQL